MVKKKKKKMMEPKFIFSSPTTTLLSFFFFYFFFFPLSTCNIYLSPDSQNCNTRLQLTSGVGPESLAFDCTGGGPYTGISDGRILRWQGADRGWAEFAFTSPYWNKGCSCSQDPLLENICGRPLGLQFSKITCDLYIADAYFGLLVVGPNGGLATPLATAAEGEPFRFTNGLDIDENNGIIYFTDTSTVFQRRDYIWSIITGDKTGRLMKYDTKRNEVTVLLRGLAFANGVALSKDGTFVLLAETTTHRILRFWLHGTKAGTSEIFFLLPGSPDNIKRNCRGEFWVALNIEEETLRNPFKLRTLQTMSTDYGMAMKLSEDGEVLEVLDYEDGDNFSSVSEVNEKNGSLWIGSLVLPYVGTYKL